MTKRDFLFLPIVAAVAKLFNVAPAEASRFVEWPSDRPVVFLEPRQVRALMYDHRTATLVAEAYVLDSQGDYVLTADKENVKFGMFRSTRRTATARVDTLLSDDDGAIPFILEEEN